MQYLLAISLSLDNDVVQHLHRHLKAPIEGVFLISAVTSTHVGKLLVKSFAPQLQESITDQDYLSISYHFRIDALGSSRT